MARGKNKARTASRAASAAAAELAHVDEELRAERAALAAAEHDAAQAQALRASLTNVAAERDAAAAPMIERLEAEAAALTQAIELLRPAAEAVHEAYTHIADATVNRLGGGREGIELYMQALGAPVGVVNFDIHKGKLNQNQIQHLQKARGQRHNLRDIPTQISPSGERVMAPLLRPQHQRPLVDAGIHPNLPDDLQRDTLDGLDDKLLEQIALSDRARSELERATWGSHPAVAHPDVLAALHPLPYIGRDIDALAEQPLGAALGVMCEPQAGGGVRPAVAARVVGRSAEQGLEELSKVLVRRQAILNAAGRHLSPIAPPPRHPRPGDCLSVQQAYTLSAFGMWLHEDDPTDLTDLNEFSDLTSWADDDTADADSAGGEGWTFDPARAEMWGQIAHGMATAVPFWLPPGQTAGYASSRALDAQDSDELRLPFHATLVVPAEPIRIDPDPAAEEQVRSGFARSTLLETSVRELRREGDRPTIVDVMGAMDDAYMRAPLRLHEALALRGGRIEAVLLLADDAGRRADLFAWCIAIPAGDGIAARFTIPASHSRTGWTSQVDNLAAVAAWGDWHPPDEELALPDAGKHLDDALSRPEFRRLEPRGGAAGVRVLDLKRTGGSVSTQGGGGTVAAHLRRGHWRRQHHGPGNTLIKRVRIGPVLVNAGRSELLPQIYRLPSPHQADAVGAAVDTDLT